MRLMVLICPLVFPEADFFSTDCRGAGCVVTTLSKARVFGVVVVDIVVIGDAIPFNVVVVSFEPFVIVTVVVIVLVTWLPFCKLNLVLFFGDCLFVCLRHGGLGGKTSSPEYDVVGDVIIIAVDVIVISGREKGRPFYRKGI